MRLGRVRHWVTVGSVCGVAAATFGVAVLTEEDPPVVRIQQTAVSNAVSAVAARDVESYWTPERMAKAAPVTGRDSTSGRTGVAGAARTATTYDGVRTVGALFFNNGAGDRYCTGVVVASRSKMLILTAAHCIHGGRGKGYARKVAFVPQYDRGRRPFGTWPARRLFVHRLWATQSDPDVDYGVVSLHPRPSDKRRIQQVVGSNRIAINRGYVNTVYVTGYPRIRSDRRDRPIRCWTRTSRHSRFQIRMECNGFYGGTSGSPWLLNFNSSTGTGYINGVLGGYLAGGDVHWRSYAAYFDKDIMSLRGYADNHA
ncbi:trypsin-like serine peptidase [Thermomonospora umbrina]|uniref:V8-like Glu-specific endopeptidase n=1 Tax=Thermomonospora umbrina TaxID=111806 RepID=A0A3D9SQ10_9ACTN|nr:trypsin-like peptidase domain-containing protein [Thermomonospora umbrina]REE96560.1 V8-like Glu-specific endopeptidase [Thermomonospora umbrina]